MLRVKLRRIGATGLHSALLRGAFGVNRATSRVALRPGCLVTRNVVLQKRAPSRISDSARTPQLSDCRRIVRQRLVSKVETLPYRRTDLCCVVSDAFESQSSSQRRSVVGSIRSGEGKRISWVALLLLLLVIAHASREATQGDSA